MILIISLPRGLYRMTICQDCQNVCKCDYCDHNLTTIGKEGGKLSMICSECQSAYDYPKTCSKCFSNKISSTYGGRDYLETKISENVELLGKIDISKRLFDPLLDYSIYSKVIITHVENIFLGIDYTSIEDASKTLVELLTALPNDCKVVLDYKLNNSEILDGIEKPIDWFEKVLKKEKENRMIFKFPPFYNILLVSVVDKNKQNALNKLTLFESEFREIELAKNQDIKITKPYFAKMIRRKGYFTMHLMIKFPKGYTRISELQREVLKLKRRYQVTIRVNPRHTL
jgi:primosomal protein N'